MVIFKALMGSFCKIKNKETATIIKINHANKMFKFRHFLVSKILNTDSQLENLNLNRQKTNNTSLEEWISDNEVDTQKNMYRVYYKVSHLDPTLLYFKDE